MPESKTINNGENKNITFEQAMARLNEIVEVLDGGELSLDGSLALFLEGAQLVTFCNNELDGAKLALEEIFPETDHTISI